MKFDDVVISIVMPVYNAGKTIYTTVESIENSIQDNNYELIIVDDGSDDNTKEQIEQMKEKNSRIRLYQKKNGGPASARNLGLSKVSGKYVLFSDADDIWTEDFMEVIHSGIRQLENRETDFIVTPIKRCTREEIKSCTVEYIAEGRYSFLPEKFFSYGLIHTSCGKIYRADIIRKHDLKFDDYRLSEDTLFNIKYLEKIHTISVINRVFYFYIDEHQQTLSSGVNKDAFIIYKEVYWKLSLFLDMKGYLQKEKILYNTLFPQFYAAILRVLLNESVTKKDRRNLIRTYKKQFDFDALSKRVVHPSFGEKVICLCICLGLYETAREILMHKQ